MTEADYYPPGAYNDPDAPWNELEYSIPVAISVTLSTTAEVVGYSPDISGEELKQLVEEQIKLPQDYLDWDIDDFVVINEYDR